MRVADLRLDELLGHLAGRHATGTLTVTTRRFRKKIFLFDGDLAGVASDNPRDLLGHVLVGWNLITEEQLAEGMRIHERLGTPLGRVLERTGAVDPESLERALRVQAEEALLELFLAPVEDQRWLENVLPTGRPLALHLPLAGLLEEALRRRVRLTQIRELLGELDVVPARTEAPVPPGLSGRDLHVLAEIDGERDLEAIALACHVVTFLAAELVERGVRQGYLTVARRDRAVEPPVIAPLVAEADAALAANDIARVWQVLEELRPLADEAAARLEVGRIERRLAEALAQRRIAGTAIPVVRGAALTASGLRPAEAFVLSRVNDRWSLREIQRIAPVGELEFGVITEVLLSRGLIELRHPKGGPAA